MATAKPTTDHDEIRKWVEARGGNPARVKATGSGDDPGILRIDFPGFSGEDTLEAIEWDEFFEWFDRNNLAMLLAPGRANRFNKLVERTAARASARKPASRKSAGSAKKASARKSSAKKGTARKGGAKKASSKKASAKKASTKAPSRRAARPAARKSAGSAKKASSKASRKPAGGRKSGAAKRR